MPASISGSSLGASPQRDPTVDLFYRFENAATAVKRLRTEVDGLGHYINYNSAHGYFERHSRLQKDLAGLKNDLKMWEARYISAGLGIVK